MTPQHTAYKTLLECTSGAPTLYSLRRTLLMLTRIHWALPSNHGDLSDLLGCYNYDIASPEKGSVAIELAAKFNGATPPNAIYVGLINAPLKRVAIGNLAEITPDGATRKYVWQRVATLRVSHVFEDADIGTLAAESTETFLAGMIPALMDRMRVAGIELLGVFEPQSMSKSPKLLYGVDVRLQIAFNWGVEVTPESHLIKQIVSEVATHQSS